MNSNQKHLNRELEKFARIILSEKPHFGNIRKALEDIYQLLIFAGGFRIDPNHTNGSDDTSLSHGVAISVPLAARCLFDIARTRTFAMGLLQAINDRKFSEKPVQVLYAGTGPYATLALLTIPFLKPGEVEFTLIDIHDQSIESVNRIIAAFNLEMFFTRVVKNDAITVRLDKMPSPDILLIECMQQALKKEPQVAIAANLAPQLAANGIMIPEKIRVSAVVVDTIKRRRQQFGVEPADSPLTCHHLGNVAELSQQTVGDMKIISEPFAFVELSIPAELAREPYFLELHTEIIVYKEHKLHGFDSGITVPVPVTSGSALAGVKNIRFTYINESEPQFIWNED